MDTVVDSRGEGAAATREQASATSWGAIIAGTVAAVAAAVILAALGAGLGLAGISPWWNRGLSVKAIGTAAVIWMIVVQWLSAGLGGYITGRLRTRWTGVHSDEVFFRDTAHGFLSWALATVLAAVVFSATSAWVAVNGTRAGDQAGSELTQTAQTGTETDYIVDAMFRSDTLHGNTADPHAEVARILAMSVANKKISADDRGYLAQLVASRTGVSAADAQHRVDDAIAAAKAAAGKARKAASAFAVSTALSLAVGAFIAAVAAAYGGHLRDRG